jgi:hypothetical protein
MGANIFIYLFFGGDGREPFHCYDEHKGQKQAHCVTDQSQRSKFSSQACVVFFSKHADLILEEPEPL